MAAGKIGSKSGGGFQFGFKMTLLCFLCMSLFQSGYAPGNDPCEAFKAYAERSGGTSKGYGLDVGKQANYTFSRGDGVKYKDGYSCLGPNWGEVFDNTICNLELFIGKDLDYGKINEGVTEAGGSATCESGKCVVPKGGHIPICGDGLNSLKPNPNKLTTTTTTPKSSSSVSETTPKPSSSAAIQIQAGAAGLIVAVMMVLIGFSGRQATS